MERQQCWSVLATKCLRVDTSRTDPQTFGDPDEQGLMLVHICLSMSQYWHWPVTSVTVSRSTASRMSSDGSEKLSHE